MNSDKLQEWRDRVDEFITDMENEVIEEFNFGSADGELTPEESSQLDEIMVDIFADYHFVR